MVPHPCPVRKAAICAVVSLVKHELQCLYGDGDSGSYSFVGTDDEDDDDNDDVEHDVKHDMIVDSRRRLEQHNIMSSTAGATARRKTRSNKQRTSRPADAGRTNTVDATVDMNGGGDRHK